MKDFDDSLKLDDPDFVEPEPFGGGVLRDLGERLGSARMEEFCNAIVSAAANFHRSGRSDAKLHIPVGPGIAVILYRILPQSERPEPPRREPRGRGRRR